MEHYQAVGTADSVAAFVFPAVPRGDILVSDINKNLAIASRSRVSCAHNMSRASVIIP